jgi:hypothetical protein
MIIEPTPTNPRSPVTRALRVAGLATAPVLLVAAVALGLAGPKPEPAPTPPPALPSRTPGVPSSPVPSPASSPDAVQGNTGSWPAETAAFANMQALDPGEAVARRAGGEADGPIVVRGHLKLDAPDGSCDGGTLGQSGPWCPRTGILADRAWAVTGADVDPPPGHLHVTLPPGVRAPDVLGRMSADVSAPPLPVVVVGRFTGTPCRPTDPARCEEPFVVDRVAWADGVRVPLTPLAEDRLETGRRRANPFELAVAPRQTPLVALLAWPATVARLDPATEATLAALEPSEPVWYLRVLERVGKGPSSHGGRPAVHWLVLDERLLDVIATGATGAGADPGTVPPERTAGADPFPDLAGDLSVRTVEATRAGLDGTSVRPVAVSGYLRDVRATGSCFRAGATLDLCPRTAVLAPASTRSGDAGIQLHIPPGVHLPPAATGLDPAPLAVVVLGRTRLTGTGGTPCPSTAACELAIDADRITWAAGSDMRVRAVTDPAIGARARAAARAVRDRAEALATNTRGMLLVSALVPRNRVGRLDPVAGDALDGPLAEGGPVWYARALETWYGPTIFPPGDAPVRVSWVVVDAKIGEPIAWGAY